MDDFENSHPEKDFDFNNLYGNDKIWVPLMLGLIFGAASKKLDNPKEEKNNLPS